MKRLLTMAIEGSFSIEIYPPSGLVVVEVHELAAVVVAASGFVCLALADVDEIFSEPGKKFRDIFEQKFVNELLLYVLVTVEDVVAAAAPDPLLLELGGGLGLGAATRVKLAVPAAAADAVDHPGRGHGVGKRRLLGSCSKK